MSRASVSTSMLMLVALASRPLEAASYRVTPMPVPAGPIDFYRGAINSLGQVAFTANEGTGSRIWVGNENGMAPIPGAWSAFVTGLNDAGQVSFTVPGNGPTQAFVGTITGVTPISLPAGTDRDVWSAGINNAGQVALKASAAGLPRLFIWKAGAVTPIPLPPGTTYAAPTGINDAGQVVFNAWIKGSSQAFIGTELGFTPIPGPPDPGGIAVLGINNAGQAAVIVADKPYLWTALDGLRPIPLSAPYLVYMHALAGIDDAGQALFMVVLRDATYVPQPYVGGIGATTRLNDVVPAGWTIQWAPAINRHGDILAYATGPGGFSGMVRLDKVADTTPPLIVPRISGTLGTNGWYRSSATLSWEISDPESAVASSSGCGQSTLSADTPGITLTCSATNGAGLSSSVPVTVKIDKTAPVITGMPAAGCVLWPPDQNMVQIAKITAADALSRIAPGSLRVTAWSSEPSNPKAPDALVTPDGSGGFIVELRAARLGTGNGRTYALSATATDLAGNIAQVAATCAVPHDQASR